MGLLVNPIEARTGIFPFREELLFVYAAEAELVADLGNLAVSELHLDELGTGEGLAVGALQRSNYLLGLGVEYVGGVAVGVGPVQAKGDPTMAARTEVDVPLGSGR